MDDQGNLLPHVHQPTIWIRTAYNGHWADRELTAMFAPSCALPEPLGSLGESKASGSSATCPTCPAAVNLEAVDFEIEPGNNYSENWTVRATVVHATSGERLTNFKGRVEIAEDGTGIYIQNVQYGASLPQYLDFTPSDMGVKDFVAKSLAGPKIEMTTPPEVAKIHAVNYPTFGGSLMLEQWVTYGQIDPKATGVVYDWMERKMVDIRESATGDVATVLAFMDTYKVFKNPNAMGQTTPARQGPREIRLNPHKNCMRIDNYQVPYRDPLCTHRTERLHFQLKRTLLHEARHAYQGHVAGLGLGTTACSCGFTMSFDGNPANEANDSDHDWLPEHICIAPYTFVVDTSAVRPECLGTRSFSGDAQVDNWLTNPANVIEHDAFAFAEMHCPYP